MIEVRLVCRIFQFQTFMADMPKITVTAVRGICRERKVDSVSLAVFDFRFTGIHGPLVISPSSDNLDIGSKSLDTKLETNLVVTLTGSTVADCGSAFFSCDFYILFLAVGACFIASGVSEMLIRYDHTTSAEPITIRLAVSDMKDGILYLKSQKAIMAILGAALFINFFITPVTGNFIPYFIRTDLGTAPAYLFDSLLKPEMWSSVFSVCIGASSLIGAVMISAREQEEKCGLKIAKRLCAFSGVMIALAVGYGWLVAAGVSLNAFLLLFCAGGLTIGFLLSFINIPLNTTLQRRVERNKLSKVGSIVSIGSQGMTPIASVLAGAALQAFGSTVLLAVCAAGFTITAVLLLTNRYVKTL